MKYGILFNKSNMNIGDDIQAYATARFLPSVDYFIDRETIDSFAPENGEPVAVIMNAWYMWRKWNWPPSKFIYPLMVGFHYADHQLANQWYGSPIKYQFLEGVGGDYLNAYGPVGCRDMFTLNNLQKLGINSYFSGCITLTLPDMPERADRGEYICVVDVVKKARARLRESLGESIEIREISHLRERDETLSWEERKAQVEELLTTYRNARCVVTRRLHCALSCLAMGVPVLLLRGDEDDTRFDPYYSFLHRVTVEDFMNGLCDYDFLNPPDNPGDYLKYREELIKTVSAFVESTRDDNRSADELCRTGFSERELRDWRHDVMKQSLELWLEDDHLKHEREVEKRRELSAANSALAKAERTLEKRLSRIEELKAKIEEKNTKIYALRDEKKALTVELSAKKSELAEKAAELERVSAELEELKNESVFGSIKRKMSKNN